MKKLLILAAITSFTLSVSAQQETYEKHDWEAKPALHNLSADESKESSIILKDKRVIEFIYSEKGDLVEYNTFHKIIRVNDDKGIERYNKVYVPLNNVIQIVDIKARTITKDGKVIDIAKNSIKEMKDPDDGDEYKMFAVEGLEKGFEIEYLYTIKKNSNSSYCDREIFQTSVPVKEASIRILSPENLKFEAKGYNRFPQPKTDTTITSKNVLKADTANIPAMEEEQYATFVSNLMRVDYKLSLNTARGKTKLNTWAEAARQIYQVIYQEDKEGTKKVSKLLAGLKLSKENEEGKIRAIENYIKTNFVIKAGGGPEYMDLSSIAKNKYGSAMGILKFFASFLTLAEVEHRIVLTTDRYQTRFDGNFDSWNFLNEFLIYFPGTKKFLAPSEAEYRYPMVPAKWTNNDGLFIKPVAIGEFVTATPEIGSIPAPGSDKSYDNMKIDITFPENFSEVKMKVQREMAGYSALGILPFYSFIPEEEKAKINDEILKQSGKDAKVTNIKVGPVDNTKSTFEAPFILSGDLTVNSLIEKAGANYLFKIGDVIGAQVELYQEKKRMNDVENDFNRTYNREIIFEIPKNYKLKNAGDLKMDVFHEEKGKRTASFTSTYKIEGNKVIVTVLEQYNQISYPAGQFEDYRKVINAAADFNKITLIFEPM